MSPLLALGRLFVAATVIDWAWNTGLLCYRQNGHELIAVSRFKPVNV